MIKNKTHKISNNEGFMTLLAVIVVGLSLVTYLLNASGTSVLKLQNNRVSNSRQAAYYLADSCAEIALQQIWVDDSYSGTSSFYASNGSCDYTVIDDGGDNRTIDVEANVSSSIQKVEVIIDNIAPYINIVSWRHVE